MIINQFNLFFFVADQARIALMNMILAAGSELIGDSPRALLFENEAL